MPYTTSLESKRLATSLNLDYIIPDSHTIILDLDNLAAIKLAEENILLFENIIGFELECTVTISRSGNKHYYLKFPFELSTPLKIALQCILGGSVKSNFYHTLAYLKDDPEPIRVFEVKKGVKP